MPDYDINVRAKGAPEAGSVLRRMAGDVSTSAREIKARMKETGQSFRDAARDVTRLKSGRGLDEVARDTGKAARGADKLKSSIRNVGRERGFDEASRGADKLGRSVENAAAKTEKLKDNLGKMRNFGAGLAVAGGAGVMLARRYAEGAKEDTSNTEALNAMLRKRGQGSELENMAKWVHDITYESAQVDDEPIKIAAEQLLTFGLNARQVRDIMPGIIGQARAMKMDLPSVAQQFGKAFASGNAGMLKRAGVTLDPADLDKIKEISGTVEKQKALFDMVKNSFENYALSMNEGLSEATIQANRLTFAMDQMNTNIGVGAQNAQNQVNGLGVELAKLVMPGEDEAQQAVGYFGTVGAYALTATGSIIGLGAQAALGRMALQQMGIVGVTSLGAIKAAALTTVGALALVAVAAIAGYKAVQWTKDALKKSDAEMENGDAREKIVRRAGASLGKWQNILGGNGLSGITADRKLLEIENKRLIKRGEKPFTAEEWRKRQLDITKKDVEAERKAKQEKEGAGIEAQINALSKRAQALSKTAPVVAQVAGAQFTGAQFTGAGVGGGSGRGSDAIKAQMRGLEDAIAAATDKAQKKRLSGQLRLLRREYSDTKAAEARAAKLSSTAEREQAKAEAARRRLVDRSARADSGLAVAKLNRQFDTQRARLEAQRAPDGDNSELNRRIAELDAARTVAVAELRAKYDDAFAEMNGVEIARVEAAGALEKAAIEAGKERADYLREQAEKLKGESGGKNKADAPRGLSFLQILGRMRGAATNNPNVARNGRNTFYGPDAAFALGQGMTPGVFPLGADLSPLAAAGRGDGSTLQRFKARVKSSGYTSNGRKMYVEFETIMLPNPFAEMAGGM